MAVSVVLFNRVLRLHDHPALATAVRRSDAVVPLFVVDPAIVEGPFGAPNRVGFLRECLADLREQLRGLGGDLVVRRGDPVEVALRIAQESGADTIHFSHDVGRHAATRQQRLAREAAAAGFAAMGHPGIAVVEPGLITPTGKGDHFKVFTPYLRVWERTARRPMAARPGTMQLPAGLDPGELDLVLPPRSSAGASPQRPLGGERVARAQLDRWVDDHLEQYEEIHDDLAGDRTSRLSPYLHFGCLSPLELTRRLDGRAGAQPFIRQLCWRDFYQQVTAAFPDIARADYRSRDDIWVDDPDLVEAWKSGRTGYPIVDAGMRQLQREGWMHNRARMITASFLVKDLGVDWRIGAAHFLHWLTDGDIAAGVAGKAVHQPWRLAGGRPAGYPGPLVDHDEAAAAFLARRGAR